MVWQTDTNGKLFKNKVGPKHPTLEQRRKILNKSLSSMEWEVTIKEHELQNSFVKFTAQVEKVDTKFTLEIYIFPNLASGQRDSRPYEKRIQLTRAYEEHSEDFELNKTDEHRCLLLGLYFGEEDNPVICAWDAYAYRRHKKPSSCYVDVKAIADAYRTGFGRSEDAKNRYVCCFRPEFIHYYLANMVQLHTPVGDVEHTKKEVNPNAVTGAENKIYYGAPGTGKTHSVNEEVGDKHCIRTVFHPDLQNGDFVGTLKPVMRGENVTYEFSPGPFAHALKESILRPNEKVFLVIEELNRAPAAAVFGDLFLLLDRDEDGLGQYDADFPTGEFKSWLCANCDQEIERLRLPANLWLLATMNSADQGVFPLDTAFRRRWNQEYIHIDYTNSPGGSFNIVKGDGTEASVPWAKFSKILNNYLTEHLPIAEDRLLGPWFVSDVELASSDLVPGKVLIYLWDDLLRHHGREVIFNTSIVKTYGDLSRCVSDGKSVFAERFLVAVETALQEVDGDA